MGPALLAAIHASVFDHAAWQAALADATNVGRKHYGVECGQSRF